MKRAHHTECRALSIFVGQDYFAFHLVMIGNRWANCCCQRSLCRSLSFSLSLALLLSCPLFLSFSPSLSFFLSFFVVSVRYHRLSVSLPNIKFFDTVQKEGAHTVYKNFLQKIRVEWIFFFGWMAHYAYMWICSHFSLAYHVEWLRDLWCLVATTNQFNPAIDDNRIKWMD